MTSPPTGSTATLPESEPLSVERISAIAKALAHPTRVRIIERLEDGSAVTARDIVSECTLAQSTVWEHLRILREAGVLGTRKDGSRISYSLRHTVLVEFSAAVVELSGSVLVAT